MGRLQENFKDSGTNDFFEKEDSLAKKSKVIVFLVVIFVILICGFVLWKFVLEKQYVEYKNRKNINKDIQEVLPEEFLGHKVLGKIKIPKINVEEYIVETGGVAKSGLISKLWSYADIGKNGNYVIMGHNEKGIFKDLEKLEKGDEFYVFFGLGLKESEKQKYVVTEKKEVEQDNLEDLVSDETKIEMTLISCTKNENKRIVVKGEVKK